jgi:predicted SAM-dependent methyltransferase
MPNIFKRIEVGSGKQPHAGYFHIDIEDRKGVDIVGDFRMMSFSDLEEIRSNHLLEHFSREEGIKVLKLWHSWLKQGGLLIIETPDFEEICKRFSEDKYWLARHAYGSQEADWAFHKDAWYEDKFKEILPQIGFEITLMKKKTSKVIIKSPKKERHILPNILVIAKKL